MNSKFGERFILAKDFCNYAEALKLSGWTSESMLEFLERERLLLPACRVRVPEEIVRKFWVDEHECFKDPSLPIEGDEGHLKSAQLLWQKIADWGAGSWIKPSLSYHPLDKVDSRYEHYIQMEFVEGSFRPWSSFRVVVGQRDNAPLYEECVDTYYHYWHIFLLAEIYNMGISMVVNLEDKDVFQLACIGKIADIPANRLKVHVRLQGLHSLREFPDYKNSFEALAFYHSYSKIAQFRAGMKADGKNSGTITYLEGDVLSEFLAECGDIAREAMSRWDLQFDDILKFIKWQCKRWDEWERLDRQLIAKEYKRNINATINLYTLLTGKEYEQVIDEVGHVTGHFKPTLDVIFPQWISNQKEDALVVLKKWIGPTMDELAPVEYRLSEEDCDQLVNWIVEEEQFQFLWYIEQLNKYWQHEDLLSLTVLAKTVEGLSSSYEHILNGILVPFHKIRKGLFEKVKWLWGDVPELLHFLGMNSKLTQSKHDFDSQWGEITSLSAHGDYSEIGRGLLKATLIRNHGLHLGFKNFNREQLLEFSRLLLKVIVLTWMHAKGRELIGSGKGL